MNSLSCIMKETERRKLGRYGSGQLTSSAITLGVPIIDMVKDAIMKSNGSVTKAAMLLGKSPNTLRYHLKKHNLKVVVRQVVEFVQV